MLAGLVAVLLPAAVLSAIVVDPGSPGPPVVDRRVGVAELAASEVVEETTTSTAVTVAPKPPAPSTTTSTRPATTTTPTTRKVTTTTSTTVAPLADPNWLTVPNLTPAGTWRTEANGVTMRLRIEPATPVAGQPVRFFMDVSGPGTCCMVFLMFGEGLAGWDPLNGSMSCTEPTPVGPRSYVTSYTYASPGAYKAKLSVVAGDLCFRIPHDPSDLTWIPFVSGYPISACIGVGPGPAADAGCPVNDQ